MLKDFRGVGGLERFWSWCFVDISLKSEIIAVAQPIRRSVKFIRCPSLVIDNYEKQRGKTTDNQIHIITVDKNQCYTSEKLTDVILIGLYKISKHIIFSLI